MPRPAQTLLPAPQPFLLVPKTLRGALMSACAALAVTALSPTAFAQATTPGAAQMADNPLLAEWDTPFGAPPFDRIEADHFIPAYERGMALHKAEIEAIASNTAAPTFDNTIVALERAGTELSRVGRTFGAIAASATNDEIRDIQSTMSPRLAAHSSAIFLDEDLFARVDKLQQDAGRLTLNDEQARVLERTHNRFVRAGARLEGADRARLAEITESLASLYTAFSQNAQKDAEEFALVLDSDADKAGLPDSALSAAAQAATDRDMDGQHVVTLARSSFEPFMTFSPRRDLRERVFKAWTNRGDNDNDYDNEETIRQILQLRLERANLLGYENFAAFRTANTMAGTPEAAHDLLSEVWEGALAKFEQEEDQIRKAMADAGATHALEPWDWWYYADKARADLYDLDEDAVKAHLSLDNIIEAQFAVANRLFGVNFTERDDIPIYHPDVRVWEMTDADGEAIGLFYGDYFARPGKRSGAWMSALRTQHKLDGEVLPLIMNNCNYNKPAPGEPALVSMREAEVVFHEFGHALHGLLSDVTHPSISGTAVDFDFVEFPAQIYEHWMRDEAVIREFATHYETGEPMPAALLENMRKAANAKSGFSNVEFIASAFVDLAYNRITDPDMIAGLDVNSFEDGVLAQAEMPHAIEMRHRSPHFRHSFAGELYAGGYYTYMWAGVLDNDGYAAFEEAGDPFDPELAKKLYDNVFSAGNSRPAMEAYTAFRGREPSVEPLLTNRGLNVAKPEM
ncbi:M3 family metallopeptidase [uncultured Algimonas sp.]|uniref:M3 family metallopeptidase n=1 Tax=uncultured Algimonas sp. TaxID=1547920 RepID=UPI00260F97DF|nr:M3 family metallopeptidase [uncultured Algimonas sp.]